MKFEVSLDGFLDARAGVEFDLLRGWKFELQCRSAGGAFVGGERVQELERLIENGKSILAHKYADEISEFISGFGGVGK